MKMPGKNVIALWLIWSAGMGLTGCGKPEPAVPPPEEIAALEAEHYFAFTLGEAAFEAQLAVQPEEMRRGLMHRRRMDWNRGMFFIYTQPQQMSFWMRNTYIPLDVGFFKPDGVLHEIYPMYPHVEDSVKSKSENIQFALEMNQGWFAQNGIRPGLKLNMEELKKALRDRGFSLQKFHLDEK